MLIVSLERLGSIVRQPDVTKTLSWINELVRQGVPVYQCMSEITLETDKFPEGHVYQPGTLLMNDDEVTVPDYVFSEKSSSVNLDEKCIRKLNLPKNLAIYNGLNSTEYFF